MDQAVVHTWLAALAYAWQTRDADAMAALFTDNASEQADPFKPPVQGREQLRAGFQWWMRDQRDIQVHFGEVDVIGRRFYAHVDAAWMLASSGEEIQERGLLVCDMSGDRVERMREFWKTSRTDSIEKRIHQ